MLRHQKTGLKWGLIAIVSLLSGVDRADAVTLFDNFDDGTTAGFPSPNVGGATLSNPGAGGNPNGYLRASRSVGNPSVYLNNTKYSGDWESLIGSNDLYVTFDLHVEDAGNIETLRFEISNPTFTDIWRRDIWSSPPPFPLIDSSDGWVRTTYRINTDWTDAQANAAGWTRVFPSGAPKSFTQVVHDVRGDLSGVTFAGNSSVGGGATRAVGFDNFSIMPVSQVPDRPADFGKQWVRSHPFTFMGLTAQTSNVPLLAESGLASAVVWDNPQLPAALNAASIPWHATFGAGGTYWPTYADAINYYGAKPGVSGFAIGDEPRNATEFAPIAEGIAFSKLTHPDKLAYTNLLPIVPGFNYSNWPQYLMDAMTTMQPDVLMFDPYPFNEDGSNQPDLLRQMMIVRSTAMQFGVPYFRYNQTWGSDHYNLRVPSESDLRYDAFSSLTIGFTGLACFSFDAYPSWPHQPILNADGTPSSMYADMQDMGPEVMNLGRSLRMLTSADVRYVPGRHSTSPSSTVENSTPTGLSKWSVGAGGNTRIQSVAVDTSLSQNLGLEKDGLVGLFVDDDGEQYFMLTDLYHGSGLSAGAASLGFIVTFSADINQIFGLDRETGAPERIDLNNHQLSLSLPGGTGDLFKFDNGYFAGIIPGDADLDGDVDLSDLGTLATSYGIVSGGHWRGGDFDLDGDVDLSDLGVLATNYGAGEAQAMVDFDTLQAVPEPVSLIGFVMLCGCRRRMSRTCEAAAGREKINQLT